MLRFSKIKHLSDSYQGIVIALGTFDGVHIGHQSILQRARELAADIHGVSMAFTFQEHPLSVIFPERAPKMIRNTASKEAIIEKLGVDILMNISFTKNFAAISATGFLKLLQENFSPAYVVVGANYTFGFQGTGDSAFLQQRGGEFGFVSRIGNSVLRDGKMVSSGRLTIQALLPMVNSAGANLASRPPILPWTILMRFCRTASMLSACISTMLFIRASPISAQILHLKKWSVVWKFTLCNLTAIFMARKSAWTSWENSVTKRNFPM